MVGRFYRPLAILQYKVYWVSRFNFYTLDFVFVAGVILFWWFCERHAFDLFVTAGGGSKNGCTSNLEIRMKSPATGSVCTTRSSKKPWPCS